MNIIKKNYFIYLPFVLPITTIASFIDTINNFDYLENKYKTKNMFIGNMTIGLSLGLFTGFTYPISIPLLLGYNLYKK
jgi:hypothetical protein